MDINEFLGNWYVGRRDSPARILLALCSPICCEQLSRNDAHMEACRTHRFTPRTSSWKSSIHASRNSMLVSRTSIGLPFTFLLQLTFLSLDLGVSYLISKATSSDLHHPIMVSYLFILLSSLCSIYRFKIIQGGGIGVFQMRVESTNLMLSTLSSIIWFPMTSQILCFPNGWVCDNRVSALS